MVLIFSHLKNNLLVLLCFDTKTIRIVVSISIFEEETGCQCRLTSPGLRDPRSQCSKDSSSHQTRISSTYWWKIYIPAWIDLPFLSLSFYWSLNAIFFTFLWNPLLFICIVHSLTIFKLSLLWLSHADIQICAVHGYFKNTTKLDT